MTQTAARPTSKQLAYLRSLAQRTGETFTYPHTKAQASAEIRRLRSRETSSPQERRREQRDIARALTERPDDACPREPRPRDDRLPRPSHLALKGDT